MNDVGVARYEARDYLGYVRAYMVQSQEWADLIPAMEDDNARIRAAYDRVLHAINALDKAIIDARLTE